MKPLKEPVQKRAKKSTKNSESNCLRRETMSKMQLYLQFNSITKDGLVEAPLPSLVTIASIKQANLQNRSFQKRQKQK